MGIAEKSDKKEGYLGILRRGADDGRNDGRCEEQISIARIYYGVVRESEVKSLCPDEWLRERERERV